MQRVTIPQQKPFIKPATILLYSGRTFCAQTIVTGCANIVVNPIKKKIKRDIFGLVLYTKLKNIIKGNVAHIEK